MEGEGERKGEAIYRDADRDDGIERKSERERVC